MSEPIKVGDLVYILWAPNEECWPYAGQVRAVREPSPSNHGEWRLEPPTIGSFGRQISWHPRRLKRIDPLPEKEDAPKREELTA